MIALWMLYGAVVALLLGGAAVAAERALRPRGLPTRWAWGTAMLGSWLLPVMMWLRPGEAAAPVVARAPAEALTVDPDRLAALLEGAAAAPAAPAAWLGLMGEWLGLMGDALLAGWVVAAAVGLALFALAVRNVARRSRAWPRRSVLGEPVRLSPDFGPAVVGVRSPEIVLPEWVLELGRTAQELVLRHEREHREAKDTLLLAAGTVATLAAPWNPALWWQLRRLRLAVELDCDARVLGTGVSAKSYGDLLLSVGERMGGSVVPVAALAEPSSFLERRLRMITDGRRNGGGWKAAVGVVIASALVAVACETPAPPVADEDGPVEAFEYEAAERELTEEYEASERKLADKYEAERELSEEPVGERRGIVVRGLVAPSEQRVIEETEAVERRAVDAARGAQLRAAERREIGNSVSLITSEEIAEAGVGVREVLRGSRVTLRGVRSIDAQRNEPLVYIDGVRMPRAMEASSGDGIAGIDPDDIDRIEVIKGTAASTLYGPEASAGVIQIFTKRRAGVDRDLTEKKRDQAGDLIESLMESAVHVKRLLTDWTSRDEAKAVEGRHRSAVVEMKARGNAVIAEQVVVAEQAEKAQSLEVLRPSVRTGSLSLPANDVLIVVDGEVRSREDVDEIEPDDIERIEVVKGDAAREAYGEKGATGVIKIFLKKR